MVFAQSDFIQMFISIVSAVLASSGLWAFLSKRRDEKDGKTQLLIGLAHDRILSMCEKYISRGYLTKEEYDDLNKYLYEPYSKLGGNGSAERMMKEVDKLNIVPFSKDNSQD